MNDHSQGKAIEIERTERCRAQLEGLSIGGRCEQIDRIPDATLLEKSVKACEDRHGHAASEATFDSCRHRIRFEWKQSPREFRCYREPFHFTPGSRDRGHFRFGFNRLLFLVREDISEPAYAPG